mmetsp:Transcript_13080/g.36741  ORF Transcript_13080/g.36741 Transcript_13080/m.36741 type:complete len:217 (-) Transcript_13080:378-1028(-)
MSRVNTQGPSSGVLPSWPLEMAVCEARARAEAGSPSTSALSVIVFTKALVPSSTLLLNLVESLESSCWISLNFFLSSPSKATPASSASLKFSSTILFLASERVSHSAPSLMALKPRYKGSLCESLKEKATCSGCTSSTASLSSLVSHTALRWVTTLQVFPSRSTIFSKGTTSFSHDTGPPPAAPTSFSSAVSSSFNSPRSSFKDGTTWDVVSFTWS